MVGYILVVLRYGRVSSYHDLTLETDTLEAQHVKTTLLVINFFLSLCFPYSVP